MEHADDTFPNDPEAVNQWNLRNTGQDEPYYYNGAGNFIGSAVPQTDQLGTVGQDIDAQRRGTSPPVHPTLSSRSSIPAPISPIRI